MQKTRGAVQEVEGCGPSPLKPSRETDFAAWTIARRALAWPTWTTHHAAVDADLSRQSTRSEDPPEPPGERKKPGNLVTFFKRYGRWIFLALGVGAVFALVHSVGVDAVVKVLVTAGPWLPLILLLDVSWAAVEGLAVLILYGPEPAKKIPVRAWLQATLVHFTTMMVLPVGRTGAEVARATLLAPHVGKTRATAGAALMQTLTLVANTIISMICLTAVVSAPGSRELSLLLFGNGAATLALGGGLYLVMRRAKIGGFLGRKFEKMAHFGPELDGHFRESRPRHLIALGMGLTGRSLQTLQYGVIFLAVTGQFELSSTLIAQGIHLVGAGLGDMVPNQVGITEGAYRIFAGTLGLAEAPEKAVAIALLARTSNLGAAGLCALVVQLLPAPPSVESPGEEGAA